MIDAREPHNASPRFRDGHGCRVLRLTGELDISVRHATEIDLREHIDGVASSVIIVDLAAVTFMDSAGLDPLLRAHAELAEVERVLALSSISVPVDRLFRLLAGIRPLGLVEQTLRARPTRPLAPPKADPSGDQDQGDMRRRAMELQAAMRDYGLLNEAIGLVMAAHECNPEQARLLLELVAGRREVSITDLAEGIVATREATQVSPPGTGPAAMVQAGARAALTTHLPSPRSAPECPP